MRWAAPLFLCFSLGAEEFESQVKTVLVERCVKCHGGDARLSDFDLTTRASLLKGGKHGPAVAPGDPDASRLFQWISAGRMPPDGKLDPAQVDAIRRWIASGAEWAGTESIRATRPRAGLDWWALQSPRKPAVPSVDGAATPIDAFLLRALREKGLDFAQPADRRTLLRRLSFDLHGLPPAPEQLDEPYGQAVERLLASPHYGERWGRHWLDVVRFGETDGGEHNNERFTAWKYRDYVIDAFNRDLPYDQFAREQIAGDVMFPRDPAKVAATSFLVSGPWDSVTKKLNQDELMRKTIRQDELDDMVTVTFATFQGLTVNCARCHDHKFDPIPTRDYYRLTAAFNGAGPGERETATAEERTAREAAVAPLQKELDAIKKKLAALEDETRARLLLGKFQAFDAVRPAGARFMPVNAIWNRNAFAPVTAKYFRFVITSQNGKQPKVDRLELLPGGHVVSDWSATEEATADRPVYIRASFDSPRTVSEIRWSADRRTASRDGFVRVYRFEYSQEGENWTAAASSLDHITVSEVELPEVGGAELVTALPPESIAERKRLVAERDAAQARLNAIPPLASVYAVKPEPLTAAHVLERGSLARPGEPVTPGALSSVSQLPADLDASDEEGRRRLALANWIADARNPLTARVIVNRVWLYHFGNGLVNTPSDFGFNGDRPSHPELLDWLAVSFMENGWSLKWLHRQILHSRAYQQSSAVHSKAHAVDAGNRLLWRMPLKRMDAEMLRDSILAVTGNLNSERGGPSFLLQKKAERGSYLHKALDNDGPPVWRRAVYRFVVRGGERVFMDSFDCPDPAVATPQRSSSNTPVQALTLLNNRFVLRQAELLGARLEREAGAERRAQIDRAHSLLYGRAPSDKEAALALKFLDSQPLAMYCRALLNSNEFVYVP